MEEHQNQSDPQFVTATPSSASQSLNAATPPAGIAATPSNFVPAQSDPLTQASEAVDACIARTTSNPNARMREIAQIRAAYIKAKFGMDLPR